MTHTKNEPQAMPSHGNAEDLYIQMSKHLNCPHCGGSGHVDDVAQPEQEQYLSKAYRLADELRSHLSIAPAQPEQEKCKGCNGYGLVGNILDTDTCAFCHGSGVEAPPQRKPQFKEFIKWAGAQGYDCAQTCNSDTGEWIVLNPMTADLWKAWQAANGIKA